MARGLTKKMDPINNPRGEERLKLWIQKTCLSMTFRRRNERRESGKKL